jgi:hypothetical protein
VRKPPACFFRLLVAVVWRSGELLQRLESPFNTGFAGFCHRFKNALKKRPVFFLNFFEKAIDL